MLTSKTIGKKIGEMRRQQQISQAELAQRLFISPQAVGKWERGESMPDILTLNRLSEIFGVDLNYFSEKESTQVLSEHFTESDPAPRKRTSWNMSHGNWQNADFSELKGLHEKLASSNMQNCTFIRSDLSGLLLSGNHVKDCDFSRSDLHASQFTKSHLQGNIFTDCNFQESRFSGSYIGKCDFSGADLSEARLSSGGFEGIKALDVAWTHTEFHEMYLADIVLEGKLENCSFENCHFKRVKFENAMLINTFFKCKSLKQISFVDCRADRLTLEFLKNGKADVSTITLIEV